MFTTHDNISVLTIDDDPDMRRSIVSYLEDMGFIVHQASGGREGIAMFGIHKPDLVFTDLMMPEVDGVAVVEAITKSSPDTPIVVISGNSSVEYAIKTVRKGAWDYITKPIHDFTQLEKVADRVLDRAFAIKAERSCKEKLKKAEQNETRTMAAGKRDNSHPVQHLAGGIAHDFKNLLTGVIGNLSIAKYHLDDSHKSAQAIKRAEIASMRATELAQQLMNLSRPPVAANKTAQADRIIDECVALSIPDSSIQFNINVADDLPRISMTEGELSQVLNNLILNSAQAMNGKGTIAITAETVSMPQENCLKLSKGEYVRITVADCGCGMTPDVLDKVFAPYFTTKPDGNGLGLASTHALVKKNLGAIAMESEPGRGTTATVTLPVA